MDNIGGGEDNGEREIEDFVYASMQDFRTNMARYVRLLQDGRYRGVIVKRHKEPVGMFMLIDRPAASLRAMFRTQPQAASHDDEGGVTPEGLDEGAESAEVSPAGPVSRPPSSGPGKL